MGLIYAIAVILSIYYLTDSSEVTLSAMVTEQMQSVLDHYNQGLSLYKKKQFEEAKQSFLKALEFDPEDGPSKLYVERCEIFMEDPPPEDWDGVFVMKTK